MLKAAAVSKRHSLENCGSIFFVDAACNSAFFIYELAADTANVFSLGKDISPITCTVKAKVRELGNLRLHSKILKSIAYSDLSCFIGIHLAGRVGCCGALMASPMIKNLINVCNLISSHGHCQRCLKTGP